MTGGDFERAGGIRRLLRVWLLPHTNLITHLALEKTRSRSARFDQKEDQGNRLPPVKAGDPVAEQMLGPHLPRSRPLPWSKAGNGCHSDGSLPAWLGCGLQAVRPEVSAAQPGPLSLLAFA